ncbi:hypothetical protein CH63R_14044 [Colletotrichum higginsianum IMI 349063]|uniref:Uncharacterized protein n=1 Tax=Colletotrichum higginsianum (strain IMI 349063) TaxID=759273 RepID=A0A1B7XSR0_COLHI|nr:hypothetical protein CH63R_14044 [Colletotrichum higginsianum IMI 349063]OBR02818.1 hypothetical protein CH63R_14044 [Colletotrichum higginsianum IMI 349063]
MESDPFRREVALTAARDQTDIAAKGSELSKGPNRSRPSRSMGVPEGEQCRHESRSKDGANPIRAVREHACPFRARDGGPEVEGIGGLEEADGDFCSGKRGDEARRIFGQTTTAVLSHWELATDPVLRGVRESRPFHYAGLSEFGRLGCSGAEAGAGAGSGAGALVRRGGEASHSEQRDQRTDGHLMGSGALMSGDGDDNGDLTRQRRRRPGVASHDLNGPVSRRRRGAERGD